MISFSNFGQDESTNYILDKGHSRLGFKIRHRNIVDVNGEFKSFTLTLSLSKNDWKNASLKLNAQTSSISTGIEGRDNHLRSEDFFDVEKYPDLSFESSKIYKRKNKLVIEGNLKMHGITKKVFLNGSVTGPITTKRGDQIIGFHLNGPVKRSDFKIGNISPGIADEVFLHADIELIGE